MALIKEIELPSGVKVNYHRVVSVNNVTNHASIIEIASYTDKSKRAEEIEALANNADTNVFIYSEYLEIPYNSELNVNSAYGYLKTLEKYSDATDD